MALTSASIQRSLQIANCCAAHKGFSYIQLLKKGQRDQHLLDEASLMVDLVDSITGFIPSGEVISGEQACATFTIVAGDVAAPGTFTVTVDGVIVYSVAIVVGDIAATAAAIVAEINSFNPQNYPYIATDNLDDSFEVCGSDFILDNGTAIVATVATGGTTTLTGGTTAVLQLLGDNCISNEGVEAILERLSILCDTPCEEFLNFSA